MPEDTWIPGREAAELLGMPQNNFLYYVKNGEITIKPGTRERMREYSREDTLKVRRRLLAKVKKTEKPPLIDWLYAADVPAGLKLSMQVYPGEVDLKEAAIYQAWRKNNQYLTMAAFSEDRQICYASVQLVPLPESIILDVLSGRREEASINPDEIRSYDEAGPYDLLVVSATCVKEQPSLLYQVLTKYFDRWIEMYPDRYIRRIYGEAVSESGMRIAQHFFMAPRPDLKYNAFMLDLQWPQAARMMKRFKEALARKAPLPHDLQWPPQRPTMPIAPPTTSVLYDTPAPAPRILREPQVPTIVPELPPGTLSLQQFADELGMSRSALRAYDHIAIQKENRPKERDRYFTPAQQDVVRQRRHK